MATVKNTRKVYIANISRHAREKDIGRQFEQCGTIASLEHKGNFGFVEYEKEEDAEKAIRRFHDSEFMSKRIIVKPYRYRGGDFRYNPDAAPNPAKFRGPRSASYRLYITGLDESTSWQDVKDFARTGGHSVCYTDVNTTRDGRKEGVIEYFKRDDFDYALRHLDRARLKGCRKKPNGDIDNYSSRRDRRKRSRSHSLRRSRSRDRDRHRSNYHNHSQRGGGGGGSSRGYAPDRDRDRGRNGSDRYERRDRDRGYNHHQTSHHGNNGHSGNGYRNGKQQQRRSRSRSIRSMRSRSRSRSPMNGHTQHQHRRGSSSSRQRRRSPPRKPHDDEKSSENGGANYIHPSRRRNISPSKSPKYRRQKSPTPINQRSFSRSRSRSR